MTYFTTLRTILKPVYSVFLLYPLYFEKSKLFIKKIKNYDLFKNYELFKDYGGYFIRNFFSKIYILDFQGFFIRFFNRSVNKLKAEVVNGF